MTAELPNMPKLMVAGPRHVTNMTIERERSDKVNSQGAHFSGGRAVLSVDQEWGATNQVPLPGVASHNSSVL